MEEIGRILRCSNEQIAGMLWLVRSEVALNRVNDLTLAQFKRLLGHNRWLDLLALHAAALAARGEAPTSHDAAVGRAAEIPPDEIAPPPLVVGDDLLALGLQPGPRYKQILDALYDAQLNRELQDRGRALEQLRTLVGGS